VAQLMREHPGYTRAQIEAAIREAQARKEANSTPGDSND
jgi:hypothetical protein